MRRWALLVGVLLALALGGLVGSLIVQDQGYVLINYDDTVIEMSVWVAVVGLVLLYAAIRFVSFAVHKITQGQLKIWRWHLDRRDRVANEQTERGILLLAERRWADARRLLSGSAERAAVPVLNYLGAAAAAHGEGDHKVRDQYLKQAVERAPSAKFAALLAEARYAVEERRFEHALQILRSLRDRAPKHQAVLAGLAACFEAREDWVELRNLLPDLDKQRVLAPAEFARLEHLVWSKLLDGSAEPEQVWKLLPDHVLNDSALLRAWVRALLDAGHDGLAEQAARQILERGMDPELVSLYGNIRCSDPARQLRLVQKLQRSHTTNRDGAAVQLALGRLCLQARQFDQARDHFEASLRAKPSAAVYGELGRLCVAMGDERRGTDYLLQSLSDLAQLPLPEAPVLRKTV